MPWNLFPKLDGPILVLAGLFLLVQAGAVAARLFAPGDESLFEMQSEASRLLLAGLLMGLQSSRESEK